MLMATLSRPSRTAVLSFSVGTQIAMAAWSVVLGFTANRQHARSLQTRPVLQSELPR